MNDAELTAEVKYQFKKTRQYLIWATAVFSALLCGGFAALLVSSDPPMSLFFAGAGIGMWFMSMVIAGDNIFRRTFNRLPFDGEVTEPEREKPNAVEGLGQEVPADD